MRDPLPPAPTPEETVPEPTATSGPERLAARPPTGPARGPAGRAAGARTGRPTVGPGRGAHAGVPSAPRRPVPTPPGGRRLRARWWVALAVVLALAPAPWVLDGSDRRGTLPPLPPLPTTTGEAPPLRSAASWAAAFDEQWRLTRPKVEGWARSGDSWQHYSLAYSIDALTSAYLATGRVGYVQDGLALLETVIATSSVSRDLPDSRFRDGYRGWASRRPEDGGDEVALYESYLWRYGTGLLRVVRSDPVLYGRADVRVPYERLLASARRDVFDKWWSRGPESYLYRERVHLSAHWALIALDLYLVDPDPTAHARYAQVVRRFVDGAGDEPGLRTQLVASPVEPTAWFWSDVWGEYTMPGQDVSHGNAVVAFAVEAHDRGVGLSDDDLRRFVGTLADVVWPRPGPGALYVGGSGTGTGWFSDGFVKLGRYDARLQARLEQHRPANGQFFAGLALNAAILSCDRRPAGGTGQDVDAPPACRAAEGLRPVEERLRPPG